MFLVFLFFIKVPSDLTSPIVPQTPKPQTLTFKISGTLRYLASSISYWAYHYYLGLSHRIGLIFIALDLSLSYWAYHSHIDLSHRIGIITIVLDISLSYWKLSSTGHVYYSFSVVIFYKSSFSSDSSQTFKNKTTKP